MKCTNVRHYGCLDSDISGNGAAATNQRRVIDPARQPHERKSQVTSRVPVAPVGAVGCILHPNRLGVHLGLPVETERSFAETN
jgi:hypothetical protein